MYLLPGGRIDHNPTAVETKSVTSLTPQPADAVNLAATITPDTDRVLAVLDGMGYSSGVAGDSVFMSWTLLDENEDELFPHQRIARTPERLRHRWSRVLTGLTPGVERTFLWGLRSSSATIGVNLAMGGQNVNALGPASMRFYSIAEGTEDLLALVQHNPSPAGTPTQASSTYADIDAANLVASFTHSGLVLVEQEAFCAVQQRWNLREGSTDLASDGVTVGLQASASNIPQRIGLRTYFQASGAHSLKWGWRRVVSTAEMFYGEDYGVAEMRVWNAEVAA